MLGRNARLLVRALAVIERDELRAYTYLSEALGSLDIVLEVDGETFRVVGVGRPHVTANAGDDAADIRVQISRSVILDLIDGEASFLDAVLARRIRLMGEARDLLRMARVQRAFTEGAVRARRLRPLLEELRTDIQRS